MNYILSKDQFYGYLSMKKSKQLTPKYSIKHLKHWIKTGIYKPGRAKIQRTMTAKAVVLSAALLLALAVYSSIKQKGILKSLQNEGK